MKIFASCVYKKKAFLLYQSRMNKYLIFVVPLFLSVVLLRLDASAAARLAGGWSPIPDVKDPHVMEIGAYAVSEYNKQSESGLKFETVVSGETQVVAGTNYKLTVAAKEGQGGSKKYEAIVWEKPWMKFRNLTSFKPVANGRFL